VCSQRVYSSLFPPSSVTVPHTNSSWPRSLRSHCPEEQQVLCIYSSSSNSYTPSLTSATTSAGFLPSMVQPMLLHVPRISLTVPLK